MTETALTEGDVVEVQTPADVVYVATLRLTAASLAARCELTIDDIEDLRLAVDEACSLLLPHATPGGSMTARFVLSTGRLSVETSVETSETAEPDRSGYAWTLLDALASTVDVAQRDQRLYIGVTKTREAAGT